jgi:hypothetical protein
VQLGDDNLGGVEGNGHALSVALVANDLLDEDGELKTVDVGDLSLASLLRTPGNNDFVVLADRNGANLSQNAG